MDKHNRPSTQFQVAGIEIGPLFDDRFLLCLFPPGIISANPDSMLLLRAHRFDYSDAAVCDGPIDFWSMPKLQLLLVIRRLLRCGPCSETLGFRQQFGLIVFQIDHPVQTQIFDGARKRRLQIERRLPTDPETGGLPGRVDPVIKTTYKRLPSRRSFESECPGEWGMRN